MATPQAELLRELQTIRPYLVSIDWTRPDVTPEKALVAAVFAKIAYLVISRFEARDHAFAKIIPCLAYQRLLAAGTGMTGDTLGAIIRDAQIECEVFVEDTSGQALIAGMKFPDVIFIALRGTRPLYISDWMIDFDFKKSGVQIVGHPGDVMFHNGFFVAITTALSKIEQEIRRWTPPGKIPVYVVGHSLGGAMTAIAHALDGHRYSSRHRIAAPQSVSLGVTASYCFGMPRCGDAAAATAFCNPAHIYNSRDIVPTVPPRRLGFSNVTTEFRVDGTNKLLPRNVDTSTVRFRGIRHHLMDKYVENLQRIV